MLPPVFQILKTSAVMSIVGTNPPRIYRHGAAPQRAESAPSMAYITWELISGVPENNLSDPPPHDRMTVQVDNWHPTDSGVELLARASRDALEQFGYVTNVILDLRDPETKLYRIGIQADLLTGRS